MVYWPTVHSLYSYVHGGYGKLMHIPTPGTNEEDELEDDDGLIADPSSGASSLKPSLKFIGIDKLNKEEEDGMASSI